jgi:hypothetical protein
MNNNFLYFSNLNDIHPQLNVIGAPEYENYKNGIIENFKKRSLKSNTKYTTTWYERYVGVIDNNEIEYSLNSSGQRCDEFKKTHEGKHILFAGCSITFGEGLPYKKNWSGYLYKKINKNNNLSGYYTIAYPGGGVDIVINNIYKYCDIYGIPDTIFLFLPESSRRFLWEKDRYYSINSSTNKEFYYETYGGIENAIYFSYNHIKNLEIFCNKLNVKLIWSAWQEQESLMYKEMDFKNYIYITNNDIINKATNYNDVDNPYYKIARDNAHPGILFSDGLSNIFLEKMNEISIF